MYRYRCKNWSSPNIANCDEESTTNHSRTPLNRETLWLKKKLPMLRVCWESQNWIDMYQRLPKIYLNILTYGFIIRTQRDEGHPDEELEDRIGRLLGKVGPSMLLASCSESLAFFLGGCLLLWLSLPRKGLKNKEILYACVFFSPGALTDMPAVRVFSLYSAMAVLLDFLFQVTVFVAVMTLDAKREEVSKDS